MYHRYECYIFYLTNNNNILCTLLYTKVYIYALQSFHNGAGDPGVGGIPLGLGANHPPHQFISHMVNDSLYIVFYG